MADKRPSSDIVEFIDKVRSHSPDCLEDFVPESARTPSDVEGGATKNLSVGDLEGVTQIGRFRILSKLGEGGFGLVFLANDPQLDRQIALKIPRAETLLTEHTRLRFLREAKAAASLNHPNIAAIHEAGEIGPLCYIVSAYCEGGSLSDLIKSKGIAPSSAIRLMATLARAVQHAHDRGIVHRDLKPANILFDSRLSLRESTVSRSNDDSATRYFRGAKGDYLAKAARIVDFGLAKSPDHDGVHTQTGAMLGTPSYMSPEQADGKDVGPSTDIYSLGAILYELLTGRPPIEKASNLETIIALKNEEPVPPRRREPACPKDLEAICLKCLDKDQRRRYASAALLADDLERHQRGEPVQARAPTRAARAWRWCRRYPLTAAFAAFVAAIAILGPIAALNQTRLYRETQQARQAERQTLYFSDMNLALRDWDEANLERCGELLLRHRPAPGSQDYRGFEWYYLWKQWQTTRQVENVVQQDGLETMALSPDGKLLAVGCFDGTIFLLDTETRRRLADWQAHPYVTFDLTFSPDGKKLASANIDSEVKLWDVATQRELASMSGSRAVAFSSVDETMACRTGTSIFILDEGSTTPRAITNAHGHDEGTGVGDVVFSPDGTLLASAGWDGWVRIWNVERGTKQMEFSGDRSALWCLDWSPDGKYLATGDVHGEVRLWDAVTGHELRSFKAHISTVRSLVFSNDSTTLSSAASDNALKLWAVAADTEMKSFRGHYGAVNSVAFAPNGSHSSFRKQRWSRKILAASRPDLQRRATTPRCRHVGRIFPER